MPALPDVEDEKYTEESSLGDNVELQEVDEQGVDSLLGDVADVDVEEAAQPSNPTTAIYTYYQSSGRFTGKARDGSNIDVIGCSGSTTATIGFPNGCRNKPECQCIKNFGPLPKNTCAIPPHPFRAPRRTHHHPPLSPPHVVTPSARRTILKEQAAKYTRIPSI